MTKNKSVASVLLLPLALLLVGGTLFSSPLPPPPAAGTSADTTETERLRPYPSDSGGAGKQIDGNLLPRLFTTSAVSRETRN